jgi:hypothetical protein
MVTAMAIAGALTILGVTLEMLRRRQLREKYAALWLVVSLTAAVLAMFPRALVSTAEALGFGVPVNLLFFAAFLLLLIVSMQLSLETGRREDETERLAEEVALLRHELDRLSTDREADLKGHERPAGQTCEGGPENEGA